MPILKRARPLLGTFVEIQLETTDRAQADRAFDAAFLAIEAVAKHMSFHSPMSDVSRLNAQAHLRPVRIHPDTWHVLQKACELAASSNGLFNIAIAPRLIRWGYLPDPFGRGKTEAVGQSADIRFLAGHRIRFRRPLHIDVGGIAKGFAVDQAVTALQAQGIRRGSVNAGGDLRVFGRREPLWIRHPRAPRRCTYLGDIHDQAAATSATYYSRRRRQGRIVTPLIGPRGARVMAGQSITVIAKTCMMADALTKVAALAGAAAEPLLKRYDARVYCVS